MQLKFIHLRCATEDQGLLPKGGATIGYSLADGRDEFQADVVRLHFVIAKCSPQDHFNKRLGRIICEGRMDAGQDTFMDIPRGLRRDQIRELLAEQYYRDEERYNAGVRNYVF